MRLTFKVVISLFWYAVYNFSSSKSPGWQDSPFIYLPHVALFKPQGGISLQGGHDEDSRVHVSRLSFFSRAVHVVPTTEAKDSLWSLFEGERSYF